MTARHSTFHRNCYPGSATSNTAIEAGTAQLENCTFAEDDVNFRGVGNSVISSTIVGSLGGSATVANSFISNAGPGGSGANSLINTLVDPQLLPLGDYGGPTPTMPPRAGSPLIDAGNSDVPPTDQRWFLRRSPQEVRSKAHRGAEADGMSLRANLRRRRKRFFRVQLP